MTFLKWFVKPGAFGFLNWLWIVAVAALIGTVVLIVDNAVDDAFDRAETKGALEAINAGQETTLEQVGAANEAEQEINRGGRSRDAYDSCMRHAATGFESGCDRYRPLEPVPD